MGAFLKFLGNQEQLIKKVYDQIPNNQMIFPTGLLKNFDSKQLLKKLERIQNKRINRQKIRQLLNTTRNQIKPNNLVMQEVYQITDNKIFPKQINQKSNQQQQQKFLVQFKHIQSQNNQQENYYHYKKSFQDSGNIQIFTVLNNIQNLPYTQFTTNKSNRGSEFLLQSTESSTCSQTISDYSSKNESIIDIKQFHDFAKNERIDQNVKTIKPQIVLNSTSQELL
ncbi:hypothetical protein PPERSA_04110 [Pseudocohnilembus persalinus]|uniref:Uncharacterized protein n=1 Tax=Pseudocohnilembus persalinus TaxID=266149 RepID=A0A0V0QMV3_PSEPJ|nr:hypothetical protein PPERSA_04110 [Pseudocohnilembus persalinus]|eukprot:KRX03558.1 hypothetical protein PPERSA_04110 [Pseudocohnilembus persalinus]